MNKIIIISLTALLGACSAKEEAKPVDYYIEHISEAKEVINQCRERVKTASDYQKIMGEENCANALLAEKHWNQKQNSSSGKTATKTEPVRF